MVGFAGILDAEGHVARLARGSGYRNDSRKKEHGGGWPECTAESM